MGIMFGQWRNNLHKNSERMIKVNKVDKMEI